MTAANNPRADLVALFAAFAAAAPAYSSLQLHGDAAAEALLAWGHGARTERRERADGSAWTVAVLDLPNRVWIAAHFDRDVAQTDQQVIARVQAALDGERPDSIDAAMQDDQREIAGMQAMLDEQPDTAEGSV